jgi:hypothetical protein
LSVEAAEDAEAKNKNNKEQFMAATKIEIVGAGGRGGR